MKNTFYLMFITILVIGLSSAACEGPAGPQGEQGLQGEQGPAGPQGPQGADGNANVTLYGFDGHDFNSDDTWNNDANHECIEVADRTEWMGSHWSAFIETTTSSGEAIVPVAELDDFTFITFWDVVFESIDCRDQVLPFIQALSGGIAQDIYIFQIRASNVVEAGAMTGLKATPESVIPADLNLSSYQAVMDYYGLTEEDIVRVSSP